MTFNLRYDNPQDGINRWDCRKKAVVQVIHSFLPDLLGTQEGWEEQINDLKAQLSLYRLCVKTPQWNHQYMFPCIWFKEDIELLECHTFWLSATPEVPFSRHPQSGYPRSATFALVRKDGSIFMFICTHLDNVSAEARVFQVQVLWQQIRRLNTNNWPVILVGDFNTDSSDLIYQFLTGKRTINGEKGCLKDVWKELGQPEVATFHGFKGVGMRGRLDWILVSPEIRVKEVRLIKDLFDGHYPSDHFPVMAVVEL